MQEGKKWWICVGKKEMFSGRISRVQRGFLLERKGKVIPRRGAEDGIGSITNSGKSGMRCQVTNCSKAEF